MGGVKSTEVAVKKMGTTRKGPIAASVFAIPAGYTKGASPLKQK